MSGQVVCGSCCLTQQWKLTKAAFLNTNASLCTANITAAAAVNDVAAVIAHSVDDMHSHVLLCGEHTSGMQGSVSPRF